MNKLKMVTQALRRDQAAEKAEERGIPPLITIYLDAWAVQNSVYYAQDQIDDAARVFKGYPFQVLRFPDLERDGKIRLDLRRMS